MKSNFMFLLLFVVTMCKAAKFPIHLSHQDETGNEEIVPVTESYANQVPTDCDFCTDYMLEDCYCEDVTYCKNQSCYVPDKCDVKKCDENEKREFPTETKQPPVTEIIVAVTAQTVGPLSRLECRYCEFMIWGCFCDDVDYCLKKLKCPVEPKCLAQCPTTTKQPLVTAAIATTKRPTADRCGNCAYMIWGCSCADMEACHKKKCTVKPECLAYCSTTTKQPPSSTVPVTTAIATTKRPTADRCGNCAYMLWGCSCTFVRNYCIKQQCTVKPDCLAECVMK